MMKGIAQVEHGKRNISPEEKQTTNGEPIERKGKLSKENRRRPLLEVKGIGRELKDPEVRQKEGHDDARSALIAFSSNS